MDNNVCSVITLTGFTITFIMNVFAELQEFLPPHRGPTPAVLPLDALFALLIAYHVGCGVTELAARWIPPGRSKPVPPTSMGNALSNIRGPLHQALSRRFNQLRARIRPQRLPLGDENCHLVGLVRQDIGLIGDCSPIPIYKPSVRPPLSFSIFQLSH